MFWPVTASTATVLAAFLPLLFWPGIVGEFMRYLPITLVATLVASLVMAMVFVPVLGGMFGRPGYQDAAAQRAAWPPPRAATSPTCAAGSAPMSACSPC